METVLNRGPSTLHPNAGLQAALERDVTNVLRDGRTLTVFALKLTGARNVNFGSLLTNHKLLVSKPITNICRTSSRAGERCEERAAAVMTKFKPHTLIHET